ncbi:MAG: hypothetical protein Q8873_00570 [Bacillota bacterium]|nr:hypothetical protein [Bacillota bacterium]
MENKNPMPLGGVIKIGNTQSKPASTSSIKYGDDLRNGSTKK